MDKRIDALTLQIEALLKIPIYIQPPSQSKIPYGLLTIQNINTVYSDNTRYLSTIPMQLIIIDTNISLSKVDIVLQNIPFAKFDKHYIADGIYHNVINIDI